MDEISIFRELLVEHSTSTEDSDVFSNFGELIIAASIINAVTCVLVTLDSHHVQNYLLSLRSSCLLAGLLV